ncbi:MAG TPA: hypothetical protein VHS99_03060 [Chloroflexota bacterium]|nr:hypothetical protein [Chloroflexota bacterium]
MAEATRGARPRPRPRFDAAATALAIALAGTSWLQHILVRPGPAASVAADRAIFLFAISYALLELLPRFIPWHLVTGGLVPHRLRRTALRRTAPAPATAASRTATTAPNGRPHQGHAPPRRRARLIGAAALLLLVTVQTFTHLDEHSPYLYMTMPGFPVGWGVGAEGYVAWVDGHPVQAEAWQFAHQAAHLGGALHGLDTGNTDARAGYGYLVALLARPFGYYWSAVVVNLLSWYAAALATWYLGTVMLGAAAPAFGAAVLVAGGQGFVAMAGTPMSYVSGYAWSAVLLALAHRWRLFGRRCSTTRWLLWGWLTGLAGLFYFTHVVLLATAWLFGGRRGPLRPLILATVLAMAVPLTWQLAGQNLVGLRFERATADDLTSNLTGILRVALHAPLELPGKAGESSLRALVGGFALPTLPLAALGVARAAPRRRQWYLAVAICGLAPVFVLHHIPVTQRYGYLAYPAVYLAAAEGAWWLATTLARRASFRNARDARPAPRGAPLTWGIAALVLLAGIQLFQANADRWGMMHFALAFGGP